MIGEEQEAECARLLDRLRAEKNLDLEAMEFFVRSEMLKLGARVLQAFFDWRLGQEPVPTCQDHHRPVPMACDGKRHKQVRTILGEVTLWRKRWVCPVCDAVRYAADETLDVQDGLFSPGVRRMVAWAGAMEHSFGLAAQALQLYGAVQVDEKEVERIAEAAGRQVEDWRQREAALAVGLAGCGAPPVRDAPGTFYVQYDGKGTPMRREELEGVAGKDGKKAKTREAKLGCVFTQTAFDDEGRPVRDEGSTTYVGAIEDSTDFGHRIYGEAVRRGLNRAQNVVALTDGQAYNKTIRNEHFPNSTWIVDIQHAREHLADFMRDLARRTLEGPDHLRCRDALDEGRIEELLDNMAGLLPKSGPRRKTGLKAMAYFRKNAEGMRYGEFRRQGLFVATGVMEAGCRTLVGQRLAQSGMFWTLRGANAIIALRCCILSGLFEDFWEQRAA